MGASILTDSGGYQIFSLANNRTLEEEGAKFKVILMSSHWFTPENVVNTQRVLGSDLMMILDECPPYPSSYEYAKKSMELTHDGLNVDVLILKPNHIIAINNFNLGLFKVERIPI